MLHWFTVFLKDRKRRIVLPGASSDRCFIKGGCATRANSLLFFVFLNDIVDEINPSIRLFADDTNLYIVDDPIASAIKLNTYLSRIDMGHLCGL